MSLVGKTFTKNTEIVVVGENLHEIVYQNINNESENLTMKREAFEANYVEVVNLKKDEVKSGGTKVSNKEETKTEETK